MSEWEVEERRAYIEHMSRIAARGASRDAMRTHFPSASLREIDYARKLAKRRSMRK